MFPPQFRVLPSIRLGLWLASIGLVLVRGSSARYDVLRGSQGDDGCTLQENVVGACTPLKSRDPSSILNRDVTTPVPSSCTCNTIFFNIWSACCYSSGNSTLPNFTNWTQTCRANSVDVEASTAFSEMPGKMGIDVPSWANLAVPGNTTFDLQRAVAMQNSLSIPVRWTPLQIMLPFVVSLATLLILGILFLIYKCKFSRGGIRMRWPKSMTRLQLHTSHKVTTSFDRRDSWEIDQDDDPALKQQPFVTSIEEDTFRGTPVRPSRVDPEPVNIHTSDKNSKTPNSNSKVKKILTGTHSFRMSSRLWKQKPRQIKLVPATSRFRVDDVGESNGTSVVGANIKEGGNSLDDVDRYVSQEDEEATDLITPIEREERSYNDVLLISKNGRPFTLRSESTNTGSVNSHIKIISPSVSSASPRSTMHTPPTKPTIRIPMPPPPPSHAAPAPPVMPRRATGNNRESSSPHFLPHSFLSPIREASSSQSHSSSDTTLRRSPAHVRRPSNPESVSVIRTSPATRPSPNLGTSSRLPPDYFDSQRTASQSSQASLGLEVENQEAFYGPHISNGHYRGLSVDDDSDASLYCASPPPMHMQPVRTFSPEIFPGPVRGAGYSRTYTQHGAREPF